MSSNTPDEFRDLRDLFHDQDPVPEHAVAAAHAALEVVRGLRELDAGRLRLISDSADSTEATPVRIRTGHAPLRTLTFAVPGELLGMDFVVTAPGLLRATGMVIGNANLDPPAGVVELRHPGGRCSGVLDEQGNFVLEAVPSGPLSVVYRPERSAPAVSDWMVC